MRQSENGMVLGSRPRLVRGLLVKQKVLMPVSTEKDLPVLVMIIYLQVIRVGYIETGTKVK